MTVSTTSRWWCMAEGCDEQGAGDNSWRQAEKHTKTTEHATSTSSVPVKGAKK